MLYAPEQFVAVNKAGLDAAMSLANIILGGGERLLKLQFTIAADALAENANAAKALIAAKDGQALFASQPAFPLALERALNYSRGVIETASQIQSEIAAIPVFCYSWRKLWKRTCTSRCALRG